MTEEILLNIINELRKIPIEKWQEDGCENSYYVKINGMTFKIWGSMLSITNKKNKSESFASEDIKTLCDSIASVKAMKASIDRTMFLEETLQSFNPIFE